MTFDGKIKTLEDLMKLDSGFAFKSSEWVEIGTPVIKIRNVQDGYVDLSGCSFVSSETAKKASNWYGEVGNTLIALTGAGVGEIGRIRDNQSGLINQRVGWVRPKDSDEEDYIYYLLRYFKTEIIELASGSAQPNVSPKDILRIPCKVPIKAERLAIGAVLSILDEKIALNNTLSKTLEDIAQTIFKSWFIDFDPVKAKMSGGKPAGMDAATAALFPDSFEKTELGLIPSGWKATKLSSSLKLCKSTVKAGPFTENVPYVPVDQIGARDIFLKNSMHGSEAKTSLVSFKKNDILFGAMRPYFHKVVLAPFDGTTRTTTFVLRAINPHYLSHSLFSVYQESAVAFATNNSQGTTIPYAVWNNSFEDLPIVLPPEPIAKAFNDIVLPMLEFGYSLIAQNRTLVEIRDGLLPRLISGDLQIPEEMLAS